MAILTPIIGPTPGDPPTYNPGMAETFSWIPVENDVGRPLFAKASYIVNLKDLTISLSAADIIIGAVELSDPTNHSIRANVVQLGGSNGNALQIVEARPLSAVRINGTTAVSGNVTMTNPTTSVRVTNTVSISGSLSINNPVLNPVVSISDNGHLDAFSRLRVSTPNTLFDSKTLHNKSSLFWSEVGIGAGTVNFTGNEDASVTLSTQNNGDAGIRQTSQRFNYQPGKSQLAIFTGVLTPTPTSIKRYGLFTSLTATPFTPNLGLYFETQTDSTSSIAVVQNNGNNLVPSVSATRQNWNIDKLDGTGPSGKVLRLSAANIFLVDFEWLGVGRVRFGSVIDGQICYCHEINNAGNVQGAYIKSPNLPVRAEIRQIGATPGSMKMICSTVMSEGGSDFTGVTRGVDTGGSSTGTTIIDPGSRRALIGVRLQSAKLDSVNEVLNACVLPIPQSASTAAPYKFELVVNPTLGGTPITWTNVDTNSNFQYAVVPDNTVTVTGGTVITSGYSTLGQTIDLTGYRFEKFLRLGCSIDGNRDVLWLVVTPIINNSVTGFHGSITFIESD